MVEESAVARSAEPRVSIGNPALDAMLDGGLVARRPYLIVGPSGTGKTTLGIQFLCEGVRRRERSLLVTLEEPPNEARVNHRGLEPELSEVEVFDAIPDIMRYERTPFKDIASVRSAVRFADVPLRIRRSPELASVEVTITALEQMLRTEVLRKGYTRLVIDSLTALQYFCMKGFDPVGGAQSFLRFLSDLHVTTLLTVESPLEDVETPERMLARGELRLFRWELDGQTVRAIGVEKFRGSSHDVRLHPYRIGPMGIAINLDVTISRDTRQIIEPILPRVAPVEAAAPAAAPFVSSVTPLVDEVRDLVQLGADVGPARTEIEAALSASAEGRFDQAQAHLSRVSSLVLGMVDQLSRGLGPTPTTDVVAKATLQRVIARADTVRTGVPPTNLPPPAVLQVQLGALLSLLPAPEVPVAPSAAEVTPPAAAPVAPRPPPESLPPTVAPAVPPTPEVVPPAPSRAAEEATVVPSPAVSPVHPVSAELPVAPPPGEARVEAPRRAARVLPPPPKPRAPAAAPRTVKAPVAPAPRVGHPPKEEPPPLPMGAAPGWPAPAPTPPAPAAAPVPPVAAQAHAPAVPAKRRRKPSAPGAAKKAPATTRVAVTHETPGAASPGLHVVASGAPAPPPHPTAPGPVPTPAPAAPKPRRKTPRKRKAPPVVSVEVEPSPAATVGPPDETSPPRDAMDPTVPPEA